MTMTKFDQLTVVCEIIQQFNGEIHEAAIKWFFDEQCTEYTPSDLPISDLKEVVEYLITSGRVVNNNGLLSVSKVS